MKSKKSNLKRRKRTRKNQKGGNPFTEFQTHVEYIWPAEKIEDYYRKKKFNDKATVVIHHPLTLDVDTMDDAKEPTFSEIIYKGNISESEGNINETIKKEAEDGFEYEVSEFRITIIYNMEVNTYIVRKKLDDNTHFYVKVEINKRKYFKNFKTKEKFFEFLGIPESGYTLHKREEETSYSGLTLEKPSVRGLDFRVENPIYNGDANSGINPLAISMMF